MRKSTSVNSHKLLSQALRLFEEAVSQQTKINIRALASRFKLSYASAYRIVYTFQECGWMERGEDSNLRSTPLLKLIVDEDSRNAHLAAWLHPQVKKLSEATGLTVKITVRRGSEAFSIDRIESQRPTAVYSRIGAGFHLVAGSSGAVFLARLTDAQIAKIIRNAPERYWKLQTKADVWARVKLAREELVAFDFGKFNPSTCTASVLVEDPTGRLTAGVTLLGFPDDFTPENQAQYKRLLLGLKTWFARSHDEPARQNGVVRK